MADLIPSFGMLLPSFTVSSTTNDLVALASTLTSAFFVKGTKELNGCDYSGEILNGKAHGKGF